MAAVAKFQAKFTVLGPTIAGPFDLLNSTAVLAWLGPLNVVIPNGTAVQSIIILGIQGLSLITSMLITSDQVVTVFYNAAVVGLTIAPGGFHAFSATSITAVAITNVSGADANVTYAVGGS